MARIVPNHSAFRKRNDSPLRARYLGSSPSSFRRSQHEKAWAPQNTLSRILARVLQAETARMARCPSARPKTAKTKNSGAFPFSLKTSNKLKIGEQHVISQEQLEEIRRARVGNRVSPRAPANCQKQVGVPKQNPRFQLRKSFENLSGQIAEKNN
jgi:hypothetical protein